MLHIKHQKIKWLLLYGFCYFTKESNKQNFYFQKKKTSKVNVKHVSREEDNACEIVSGEPDAKLCIYVNESLTKQNRELRKARERERESELKRKVI